MPLAAGISAAAQAAQAQQAQQMGVYAAQREAARKTLGTSARVPKPGEKMSPRIGQMTAFSMLIVASLMDAAQFFMSFFHVVPIVGNGVAVLACWFIAFLATFIFWLWFKMKGIDYFGGKQAARKALIAISVVVLEIIPIIDALPAITSGVLLMIVYSRLEENDFNEQSIQRAGHLAQGVANTAGRIPVSERTTPPGYERWSGWSKSLYEKAHSKEAGILANVRGGGQRTSGEARRGGLAANDQYPKTANDNAQPPARAFDVISNKQPYGRDTRNTQKDASPMLY